MYYNLDMILTQYADEQMVMSIKVKSKPIIDNFCFTGSYKGQYIINTPAYNRCYKILL